MRLLFGFRRRWLGRLPQMNRPDAAVLDVGCGDGQFLAYLASQGFRELDGVEPSQSRRQNACVRGLRVAASLDELDRRKFDIIFLWHVLEHVPAPMALLRELCGRLDDRGVLVVSIPNHAGWQTRYFGSCSAYLDYGRHLWYWDSSAIDDILKEELPGMRVREMGGRNFEYEIFGWVDTLGSRLAGKANFIHSRLKKKLGSPAGHAGALILAGLLLPLAGILALLLPPSAASTLTLVIERDRGDGVAADNNPRSATTWSSTL
ncbi:MAG: class I SAM-dependent methyltransferase [Candidatus Nitricoxidivorans perseverans]|uniref:Class I SAM-dependent methyltransferase n=1 Tax=Candidatus Nitricoxidivorans perseverans TaxID=2975601 RepID=A0AA49FJY3_9PROT|nr:MAG: class I SAM-dependent methyltransferase [Candidatus Nitricoxidivorans perseverans]